jgi:site-specific recombinase XerD
MWNGPWIVRDSSTRVCCRYAGRCSSNNTYRNRGNQSILPESLPHTTREPLAPVAGGGDTLGGGNIVGPALPPSHSHQSNPQGLLLKDESQTASAELIHVISAVSPLTGRPMYSIWKGIRPLVAANNYLRAQTHLAPTSLKTTAYNLLPWFRFLGQNDLLTSADDTRPDFWALEVRSATARIPELFRDTLDVQRRTNAITDATARKYLEAAYALCCWWRQSGEPQFGNPNQMSSSGVRSRSRFRAGRDVPQAWRLPSRRGRLPPPKALAPETVDHIWDFLSQDCRPSRPPILASKPRRGWSEPRRRAYAAAADSYIYQRSLYCRNLAVWGAFEATGARRSELPLLTLDDVLAHKGDDRRLFLQFLLREETRHLGTLKSGGGSAYIGWNTRAVDVLTAWLNQREVIVARAVKRGMPEHCMLFTNDDGSPLTVGAITHLFRRLRRWIEISHPESVPPARSLELSAVPRRRVVRSGLYPHLIRHTLVTTLRSAGVSPDVIRRQLRHRSLASQDLYGDIYDDAMAGSLERMVADHSNRAAPAGHNRSVTPR